jgi:sulfate permease, SulP family
MSLINTINFRNLQGDLFGGLTAAIVSLPLALAFGVASGAGPVAGLYGAVCVGFFAALFDGTPTLISEPTAPMTVVMAAIAGSMTFAFAPPQLLVASLAKTGEVDIFNVIYLIVSATVFIIVPILLGKYFNQSFVAIAEKLQTC